MTLALVVVCVALAAVVAWQEIRLRAMRRELAELKSGATFRLAQRALEDALALGRGWREIAAERLEQIEACRKDCPLRDPRVRLGPVMQGG